MTIYRTIKEWKEGISCIYLPKGYGLRALCQLRKARLIHAAKHKIGTSQRKLYRKFNVAKNMVFKALTSKNIVFRKRRKALKYTEAQLGRIQTSWLWRTTNNISSYPTVIWREMIVFIRTITRMSLMMNSTKRETIALPSIQKNLRNRRCGCLKDDVARRGYLDKFKITVSCRLCEFSCIIRIVKREYLKVRYIYKTISLTIFCVWIFSENFRTLNCILFGGFFFATPLVVQ